MSAAVYFCPACREACTEMPDAWHCPDCERDFPVLFGIPDFRLSGDRYLSLDDERAKAARLYEFGRDHSFAELVEEYYRITDDVPPEMAKRYAGYVISGEIRGAEVLPRLPRSDGRTIDIGCGAGGLVLAMARAGRAVTGTDIALRWLVIAKKRLEEAGQSADLVCADILAPPFPPESFNQAAALDLFEHVAPCSAVAAEIHHLLAPGGTLYATAANRFTPAAYPPAGLVGVGFMPEGLRRRYVIARRGLDTLRHLNMQTPRGLELCLSDAGFAPVDVMPMEIGPDRPLGPLARRIRPVYSWLRDRPVSRSILTAVGPVFEVLAERAGRGAGALNGKEHT